MADVPLEILGQASLGDERDNPAAASLDAGVDSLRIVVGDITSAAALEQVTEGLARYAGDDTGSCKLAIVNAANEQLAGGGGVDGAIHLAAGHDQLQAYTRQHYPQGCPTGLALLSPAFGLEEVGVSHIIHAVGPVWGDEPGGAGEAHPGVEKIGNRHEDVLLASCYLNGLRLCVEHGIEAIAFPGISTGVYGFPKERAARIALGHVLGHLRNNEMPRRVAFCCFSEADAGVYREQLGNRASWMTSRRRV